MPSSDGEERSRSSENGVKKKSVSQNLRGKVKHEKELRLAAEAQNQAQQAKSLAQQTQIDELKALINELLANNATTTNPIGEARATNAELIDTTKKRRFDSAAPSTSSTSSAPRPIFKIVGGKGNSTVVQRSLYPAQAAVPSTSIQSTSSIDGMDTTEASVEVSAHVAASINASSQGAQSQRIVLSKAPIIKPPPARAAVIQPTQPQVNINVASPSGTQTIREKRPPPIKVSNLDVKKTSALLEQLLGHKQFTFHHASAKDMFIRTTKIADHKAVIDMLKQSDVQGHSFTPKGDRKTTLLLRNVCSSFDEEDIATGIGEYEIDVRVYKIEPFSTVNSRRDNTNLGIWRVTLEAGSDIGALLAKKYIGRLSGIRYERMRSDGPTQCRNCQQYGHAASNCFRGFRCVKCCITHLPGACPTDVDQITPRPDPKCVNCGENGHPANFRGCATYKTLRSKMEERKQQSRDQQAARQRSYNNFVQPNTSYASRVFNNTNVNANAHNGGVLNTNMNTQVGPIQGFDINNECTTRFGYSFDQMMSNLTKFAPIYARATDKSSALIQFMISIHPSYRDV